MSQFFSTKYQNLVPYTPGEQPRDTVLIKLNTNESPFPPAPKAVAYAADAARNVQLYSDPECKALVQKCAAVYGVDEDSVLCTNGSDEILNFAFMAYCDAKTPAAFPNITYGFYKVFAEVNRVPYTEIPLRSDFSIAVSDYLGIGKTIFIANPNAPTGIALSLAEIETILQANPHNVVVIDEAYVDFGNKSAVPLIHKYENLLVTQTFSKSRSLAGARLGMGFGCKALIQDLNTIKYATNPYNVNRMTMAMGIGALEDEAYMAKNCLEIAKNREYTAQRLKSLGFEMTPSTANFLFVKHQKIGGEMLYKKLKARGILVRHFKDAAIADYNRVTIGTAEQMRIFVQAVSDILEEV